MNFMFKSSRNSDATTICWVSIVVLALYGAFIYLLSQRNLLSLISELFLKGRSENVSCVYVFDGSNEKVC